MEKTAWILIIAFFILLAVFVLLLYIRSDIRSAQLYKYADRTIGVIKRQLEDCRVSAYGSGMVGMRRRIYHQYEVEYQIQGRTYTGILQTRKKLEIADKAELRYILKKDSNEPELITSAYADRLKELAIGIIFGVILAAGIIILKMNGRI